MSTCRQHVVCMLLAGAASIEGNIIATLAGCFCANQILEQHDHTAVSD